MSSTFQKHRILKNRGFNLIEISVVLGIVGLVVAGTFAAWGSMSTQTKIKKSMEQATVISNGIRNSYASQSSMEAANTDLTPAVINGSIAPASWLTNGNITNAWGGNVTVAVGATSSQFAITFSGIPGSLYTECVGFANAAWNAMHNNGMVSIQGNGNTKNSAAVNVGTLCATGATATTNLVLTYNLKTN